MELLIAKCYYEDVPAALKVVATRGLSKEAALLAKKCPFTFVSEMFDIAMIHCMQCIANEAPPVRSCGNLGHRQKQGQRQGARREKILKEYVAHEDQVRYSQREEVAAQQRVLADPRVNRQGMRFKQGSSYCRQRQMP